MSSCFPRGTSRCGFEGSGITKPHPAVLSSVLSASPSSTTTFTDSTTTGNNSLTISNKKQRTQRKRPNETYKEAAALLSAVYPKLFSSAGSKSAKTGGSKQFFHDESPPELLDRPPGFVGADTELLIYRQVEKIQLDRGGGEDDASDSSGISPVSSKFRCMGIWSSSDEKSSPRSEIQSSSSVNLTDSDLPDSGTEASSFQQQLASADNAGDAGFPKCCQMDEFSETENSGQLSPIYDDVILYDDDVIHGAGASPAIIGEGFEAESLLENEIDKGLDGILGKNSPDDNSGMDSDDLDNIPIINLPNFISSDIEEPELWALRRDSDRIPAIDMLESFPRLRLVDKIIAQEELSFMAFCSFDWMKKDDNNNCSKSSGGHGLNLKLNHEKVLDEWSDRGPLHATSSEHGNLVVDGNGLLSSVSPDSYARLTEFDVFPDLRVWRQLIAAAAATDHEDQQQLRLMSGQLQLVGGSAAAGGVREASVLRYKEKRRTRLFSKKIRYEVRKVNADQRPRMKGRFVRRP